MKTTYERLFAYGLLILFLLSDLWLFRLSLGNSMIQTMLVCLAIMFYVVWGVWLHKMEDRLHHSLVAEYVLLGLLAGSIFYIQLLF